MSAIEKGLKKENEELKKDLSKAKKEIANLEARCDSYETRIEHFAYDKEELLKTLRVFESLELELKIVDIDEMEIESDKLKHRIYITKKLLNESKDKLANLDMIILGKDEEIAILNKKLNEAYDKIANLEAELATTLIRKNQRIYSLESRLNIAYDKIADLKYILGDIESLGFWKRLRNQKPKTLIEYHKLK